MFLVAARWDDPMAMHWVSADPLGLAPDSNPYRYVSNSPANVTDPSGEYSEYGPLGFYRAPCPGAIGGLAGTGMAGAGIWSIATTPNARFKIGDAKPYKTDSFDFKGGKVFVHVYRGVDVFDSTQENADKNTYRNQMGIIADFSRAVNADPKKFHWLQFITREFYEDDKDKTLIENDRYQSTGKADGKELWHPYNEPHVDCSKTTDPYYVRSGGLGENTSATLSMFDSPGVHDEKGFGKKVAKFDTYLIYEDGDNTEVLYHVHWERIGELIDGKWEITYPKDTIKLETANKLAKEYLGDEDNKLIVGYKERQGGTHYRVNHPIPKKVQQGWYK
jgi:hypothetical protein